MANFVSFLDLTSPSSLPRTEKYHDQFPLVLMDSILPCLLSVTISIYNANIIKNKITNII